MRAVWSVAVFLALSAGVLIASGQSDRLAPSSAWVKAPASGDTAAMAFATIENPGMYEVFLTSATADVAAKVEFRDKSKGSDRQAQTVKFLTVPAYGNLSMAEDGVHLMLLDLKRPLREGDEVSLTLVAEDGTKFQLSAAVRTR